MRKTDCRVIGTAEAAKILREAGFDTVNVPRLNAGLQQGVYPFGVAISLTKDKYVYEVYPILLYKWIEERS